MSTLLADVLREAGYMVTTMPNGATALAYLRHTGTPTQLILLDLMMPVMDGWHFRTLQSADPVLAAIPAIVLSAHVPVGRRAGLGIVADDYLSKPLDVAQVLDLVGAFVLRNRAG